jgi:hypothetical protein
VAFKIATEEFIIGKKGGEGGSAGMFKDENEKEGELKYSNVEVFIVSP